MNFSAIFGHVFFRDYDLAIKLKPLDLVFNIAIFCFSLAGERYIISSQINYRLSFLNEKSQSAGSCLPPLISRLGIFSVCMCRGYNFYPIATKLGIQVVLENIQVKFENGLCGFRMNP